MKKACSIFVMISILIVSTICHGQNRPAHILFDPDTIENINGRIVSIDLKRSISGIGNGTYLLIANGPEKVEVFLGPIQFIAKQPINLSIGDIVEIKGSRITYDNGPLIMAIEIKTGDKALKLRDEDGYPVWSKWKR